MVAGTPDPQLLDAMTESVRVEVQDSRCTLWSLNDTASLMKCGEDVTALYLLQSEEPSGFGAQRRKPLPKYFKLLRVTSKGRCWNAVLTQ